MALEQSLAFSIVRLGKKLTCVHTQILYVRKM